MSEATGDLSAFFTQDHRDCDSSWAAVEAAADGGDAAATRAAFQSFDRAMRRHLDMEEEVLFPAFEEAGGMPGGCGPTFVMRQEHQQMRAVLEAIGEALEADQLDDALDQGDTLLMLIQQHNLKEENVLYPMAREVLQAEWPGLLERLQEYEA